MLTHPLTLAKPAQSPQVLTLAVACTLLLTALSCSLLPTALVCSLFLTDTGTFLPSSSSGLVGDLAHKPFVWLSRQNRQRDPLTSIHTHRNECHTSYHIKENQKLLEEEVKEIRSKINIFPNQQTPPQKKIEENNAKSIIKYLEKNYNYVRNMGETQTKEKTYRTKIDKLKIWGNLLNQRKNSHL